MRAKSRYSLQRTMIIYFLLIGFASILLGIEFFSEFHGGELKSQIWEKIQLAGQAPLDPEALFVPIDRLRSKAILMVVIIMVVMVIVLTMFIKHITEPLQHMIQLSRQISAGDLSQTITIDTNNELADLGHVINEMATNLQEVILLSQGVCINGKGMVDDALIQLQAIGKVNPEVHKLDQILQKLGEELATLNEVMDQFDFYTVDKKENVR